MTQAPTHLATAYTCPRCAAYAKQEWHNVFVGSGGPVTHVPGFMMALCSHCNRPTIWRDSDLIWPADSPLPLPSDDLSADIRFDFNEARDIAPRSPRGAAALFRLCIQKLCAELGQSGRDLNADIAALVKAGLHPQVQKSLDIVRVIGNEAVHPGTLDLRDDRHSAVQLARLVNLITDALITQPKAIDALYQGLPEGKRQAIEARDTKKSDL